MQAWLKAGLIGAAILVILNLFGLIPVPGIGCITFILSLLAYAGIGALAASYLPPPRDTGRSAGQGALAGGLGAVIGGLVGLVITLIQAATIDSAEILSQLPPDVLRQMQEQGIDPNIFLGPGWAAIAGTFACGIGLILGVGLGALGGLIYASTRPQ